MNITLKKQCRPVPPEGDYNNEELKLLHNSLVRKLSNVVGKMKVGFHDEDWTDLLLTLGQICYLFALLKDYPPEVEYVGDPH
jgi:hypothetical protein